MAKKYIVNTIQDLLKQIYKGNMDAFLYVYSKNSSPIWYSSGYMVTLNLGKGNLFHITKSTYEKIKGNLLINPNNRGREERNVAEYKCSTDSGL